MDSSVCNDAEEELEGVYKQILNSKPLVEQVSSFRVNNGEHD